MPQLAPIQLEDGTVIYIEVDESVTTPPVTDSGELTRVSKGPGERVIKNFQAIQNTIRTYTTYTLNALKEAAPNNVDKVTLEFGVQVAAEGGMPYIAKGSAECNLKITVECSFLE